MIAERLERQERVMIIRSSYTGKSFFQPDKHIIWLSYPRLNFPGTLAKTDFMHVKNSIGYRFGIRRAFEHFSRS